MNLFQHISIRDLYWRYRCLVINALCVLLGCSEKTLVPDKIRKLLVLSSEGMIGDFVLMSPFLKELRRLLPETSITLTVPGKVYPLAANCPHVNRVIVLPDRSIRSLLSKIMKNILFARRVLRPEEFDAAILTTDNVDYYLATFMIYFAGIPVRIGFGNENSGFLHKRKSDLMLENLFNIRIPFRNEIIHQKDIFLQLLEPFGTAGRSVTPEIWGKEDDAAFSAGFFQELNSRNGNGRPYFAIGISAAALKRDWGIANYKKFIEMADAKYNPFWIFIGPGSDGSKYATIFDGISNSFNAAGRFSLTELYSVLKNCVLYIGPDSGPAHIAAASGCRVLEISCHPEGGSIYSINSPERFGPVADNVRIVRPSKAEEGCSDECRSFRQHCILNISPGDVLTALDSLCKEYQK